MGSSPKAEERLVAVLQEHRVLEMKVLCALAGCCRMTAFRGLKDYGYFTSYNANSGYYTLRDIPHFDLRGLWEYGPARFSRHGTIAETLLAWVQESPGGLGRGELGEWLGVDVHCHTSALVRSGRLARRQMGRRVVYLSAVPERQAAQEAQRQVPVLGVGLALPEGLSASAVVKLLVEMIRAPEASPVVLAHRVSAQGERLSVAEVRRVAAFWELGEKGGACASRRSCGR